MCLLIFLSLDLDPKTHGWHIGSRLDSAIKGKDLQEFCIKLQYLIFLLRLIFSESNLWYLFISQFLYRYSVSRKIFTKYSGLTKAIAIKSLTNLFIPRLLPCRHIFCYIQLTVKNDLLNKLRELNTTLS